MRPRVPYMMYNGQLYIIHIIDINNQKLHEMNNKKYLIVVFMSNIWSEKLVEHFLKELHNWETLLNIYCSN